MPVITFKKLAVAALASVAVLGLIGIPASGDQRPRPPRHRPQPKIIRVADDYFAPARVTVAKNKLVRWVWNGTNTDSHNVVLTRAPRGVPKRAFKSATGSIGIRFQRRLVRPGNYHFICTIHPTVMKLDITVRRPVRR